MRTKYDRTHSPRVHRFVDSVRSEPLLRAQKYLPQEYLRFLINPWRLTFPRAGNVEDMNRSEAFQPRHRLSLPVRVLQIEYEVEAPVLVRFRNRVQRALRSSAIRSSDQDERGAGVPHVPFSSLLRLFKRRRLKLRILRNPPAKPPALLERLTAVQR